LPCTCAERISLIALCALAVAGCGQTRSSTTSRPPAVTTAVTTTTASTTPSTQATPPPRPAPPARPPFAVGLRLVTFVDRSRSVLIPGIGRQPRTLVTVIRYPRAAGHFPLVVFGHGFAVTPTPYAPLLQAWARAGYVVAAPIFPLENQHAPGGPNENDLVNQPRDMSFVISQMLTADRVHASFLHGLLNPSEVAVTGQSDGGETALAVAYDGQFIDRRVRAAMILSGAKIPGVSGFDFPAPSPPLLATQGTADTINPPSFTHAFFDGAPAPKFLLDLLGAPHLGPYTGEQPFTSIVERVTIAFLDHYLKGQSSGLQRMRAAGDRPGVSVLDSSP
jgi:dienelactone hydrolase